MDRVVHCYLCKVQAMDNGDAGLYCGPCFAAAAERGENKVKLYKEKGVKLTWWRSKDAVGLGVAPEDAKECSYDEAMFWFKMLELEQNMLDLHGVPGFKDIY